MSLTIEYMNGGSLSNLVECVGSLPENILITIAQSIADTINFMHNKAKISHNGLSMSQIMFDREGNMKIDFASNMSMASQASHSKIQMNSSSLGPSKLSSYYMNQIKSPARMKKLKMISDHADEAEYDSESKKEIFAQDIFDLGYIILI